MSFREIIGRRRRRVTLTLQIPLCFVQRDGGCHSKGSDRGQSSPLHLWQYPRDNGELNFNRENLQGKIKRPVSPGTVNLECCSGPGWYCSLPPSWTTTHFPPSERRDTTLSRFLLSPRGQRAAIGFSLQHCPSPPALLPWWMRRWELRSLSAPYLAFSLPVQLGGIGSSSSTEKQSFPINK